MNLQQAVMLIRTTFMQEQKGNTKENSSSKYNDAMKKYPVTMATAMGIWVHENTKNL